MENYISATQAANWSFSVFYILPILTLPVLRPESGLYFASGSRTKKEALKRYKVHEHPPNGICYVAIEMGIAGSGLTV